MKFIHLTDTHFVPEGQTLYGRDPRLTLERAVWDINRHHGDADCVVVTGDLTHWGEAAAFDSLAQVLDDLAPPVVLLLGNHDDRQAFQNSFPNQKLDENGFVQSVRRTAAGHMIFLDTNMAGTHAGWYCERRRDWLAARLDDAAVEGAGVFLFMHHPPFRTGLPTMDPIALQEPDAFAAVIAPHAGRIRHLFYGHVHRPVSGSWMGIPTYTVRAINHQVWLDFSPDPDGETPGSFEPPAYAIVLVDGDTIVIHAHDFMDDSPKFSLDRSPVDDWANRYEGG